VRATSDSRTWPHSKGSTPTYRRCCFPAAPNRGSATRPKQLSSPVAVIRATSPSRSVDSLLLGIPCHWPILDRNIRKPTRLRRYGGPWRLQPIGSSQDEKLTPGGIRTRSGTTKTRQQRRYTKATTADVVVSCDAHIVDRGPPLALHALGGQTTAWIRLLRSRATGRPLRSINRNHCCCVKQRRLSVVIMR
jgi:hypothetical protein